MHDSALSGLGLVLAAGLFQGSFLFPSKWMQDWAWENYWLIFATVAYLVCPVVLAVATVPNVFEIYGGIPAGTIALMLLCGFAWGLGALTFGLGVDALGLALGFAVILGIAATCGALIPFLMHPPEHFSITQTLLAGGAIALMLGGVSGLLSSCGNLGFVFGAEVSRRAESSGVPTHLASNAIWVLLAIPLFLCNFGYASWLLLRNSTAASYQSPGSGRKLLLGLCMAPCGWQV